MNGQHADRAGARFREAMEALQRADGSAAVEGLNAALADGLADAGCGLALVKVFTAQGDRYDEIIKELDGFVQGISGAGATPGVTAYGYYLLGRGYAFLGIKKERFFSNLLRMALKRTFQNELMEKAVALYEQSIGDQRLQSIGAAFELGLVFDIGLNWRERAVESYGNVLRMNPGHGPARLRLASLYSDAKQIDLAEKEARALVASCPSAVAYTLLSGILARQRKMGESSDASRMAIHLREQPGLVDAFQSHNYLLSPTTLAAVPEARFSQVAGGNVRPRPGRR